MDTLEWTDRRYMPLKKYCRRCGEWHPVMIKYRIKDGKKTERDIVMLDIVGRGWVCYGDCDL